MDVLHTTPIVCEYVHKKFVSKKEKFISYLLQYSPLLLLRIY